MLGLLSSLELGYGTNKWEASHISEALFITYPGETSEIRIQDITPFAYRQTYLIAILLQDRHFIYKSKLGPILHKLTVFSLLCFPTCHYHHRSCQHSDVSAPSFHVYSWPIDQSEHSNPYVIFSLLCSMSDIWSTSEFPSQTCALLLLVLYSVCHVTIAHCNDSNGTDTRIRVQCNDSDVTDRKQSRVCNDSTVTDICWAITTCDGHTNCWQSKVWKPQHMELPYSKWNLVVYAWTLQCDG